MVPNSSWASSSAFYRCLTVNWIVFDKCENAALNFMWSVQNYFAKEMSKTNVKLVKYPFYNPYIRPYTITRGM